MTTTGTLRRSIALALAVATVSLSSATGAQASTAVTRPRPHWASGTYVGSGDVAAQADFGRFRHRATDVASTYMRYDSWDTIAHFTYMLDSLAGYRGAVSVAVPMLPADGSSTFADVVAGQHDEEFRSLARNVVASGRGDAYIRLGWEFNGNWYPWAANNPAAYKAAFRREVTVLRSVAPGLRIEWDGNLGYSQVGHDPMRELYPGDDVVTIVGVDAYDNEWEHVHDQASWTAFQQGDGGLQRWLDFARRHHKKFAIPEWGLVARGGGDNPYFIQKMHDFLLRNARAIAYECYFNTANADTRSSLTGPALNRRSAALYVRLWQR